MKPIRILVLTLLAVVPFAGSNAQTCDLHKKVEEGDITAVRNMLEAGCDVDVKDSRGRAPLHTAVIKDKAKIARLLLDAGANVDSQGNHGWAPLHLAAQLYRAEIAQMLIDADASVDLQTSSVYTPLYLAASASYAPISFWQRREDTVRVLLDAGANVKITADGETPLHAAAGASVSNNSNLVWHEPWDETSETWHDGFGVVIRMLADAGADVHAKDHLGQTPLHHAMYSSRKADAIRAMVEVGADINAQNNDGNTPLHIASMAKLTHINISMEHYIYVEAIPVLLELGADDQIKNNAKFKPKAIGKTKEIRKLLKTPGLYWPIKAYAMGNASSNLIETSARIGCADKKKCRVFLECTDKDGDEFKGSLDSASKEATAEDSIDEGATVSLSASEIKTITGATGDEALDCALRSQQRVTAQVWSSTDSVNANTTAYRLSEDNEARIQFKVGESNTPFVNIRCLAAKGEQCTKTKLVCTDDRGRDWPKIKAGTIDRLNVYTVSTAKGADHRIDDDNTGWYSCDIKSENPFMVYATHLSTKGDSRSLVSATAVSME